MEYVILYIALLIQDLSHDLIIWFLLFELKGPINMFYTLLSAQAFETDMSPHQVLDLN